MSRRLSIDSIRRAYLPEEADLSEGNSGSGDQHCESCGALVVETEGEIFPTTCAACGHETKGGPE